MVNNDLEILSIVRSVMGEASHHHSGCQISFNCPNCDDGRNKGKLEINYGTLVMKCWSCENDSDGLKGSLYKLIKRYGNNRDLQAFKEATEDHEYGYVAERNKDYIPNVNLPNEYIKIKPKELSDIMIEPYNYLINRGIDDESIEKNEVGFCYDGYYGGRIIVPSFSKNNKLNFFVGRTYCKQSPKYLNPQVIKTEIVVNELNINWDSTVYLVEGMFDYLGLGLKNTIPLLGKVLTIRTLEEIIDKAKGYVVILLDPDAKKEAYKMYNTLASTHLGEKVRVIDLPLGMDIAEIREKFGQKGVNKCLRMVRKLTFEDYIEYDIV